MKAWRTDATFSSSSSVSIDILPTEWSPTASTTKANSRVAEALYRTAIAGGRERVTAAIFWLKTRAGWKETTAHELALAEGAAPMEPLKIVFVEGNMTRVNELDAADRERRPGVGVAGPA